MNTTCPICGSRTDPEDGNVFGGLCYCTSCVWDALDGEFDTASKEQLETLHRAMEASQ